MLTTKNRDTDKYWENIAQTNPYWGVDTLGLFHKDNLTPEVIQEFYARGEGIVTFLWHTIRRHLDANFSPTTALDFGCGVGRIALALARQCRSVVGVDVSESFLQEARRRGEALGLDNVRFEKSDDQLQRVPETFDLVNSYIVLQHIACPRGEKITRALLQRLNDGGVGVLHFTYYKVPRSRRPKLRALLEKMGLYPFLRAARAVCQWFHNLLPWKCSEDQEMPMNAYHLNTIFRLLQQAGIRRFHVELTDHGGCYGVLLFFQKREQDRYMI